MMGTFTQIKLLTVVHVIDRMLDTNSRGHNVGCSTLDM